MRKSEIARKTGETEITLQLNLDGTGQYQIQTGVGFLDHMLTGFARHGSFDLAVQCQGDTWVDDHHTVEDVGICLGQAFAQALGDLRGVERSEWLAKHTFYKHIGMYAFRTKVLAEVTALPQSSLEKAESLEQLRWLENGYRIGVGISDVETIGIDTPEDLAAAEEFLKRMKR